MTIKTFWAMSVEDSAKYRDVAESHRASILNAKNYVTERIPCDGVFLTQSNAIYLGFKRKQDNPMLHKRPAHQHDGQYLYCTKAKTDWDKIVIEATKIARSAVKFDKYMKDAFPQMLKNVLGSEGGSSFSITETGFGFMSDRVVAVVPFSNDSDFDSSFIPKEFKELTASEFGRL